MIEPRLGARAVALFLALLFAPGAPAQGAAPQSAFLDVPLIAGAPVLAQPDMAYPREARARGLAGTVVVAVLVGEDGAPVRHRILSSEPPLIFDAAVNAAIPGFRFAPATREGRPSQYETHLTLAFDPQRAGAQAQ